VKEQVITDLKKILGPRWVDDDLERVEQYSKDHTLQSYGLVAPAPAGENLVVKPGNTREVSEVMRYAYARNLPVIPRGAGTALASNSVPSQSSIILSLERMNRVLEVDDVNLVVTCEAAVSLGDLIGYLKGKDKLYFPLHPGDEGAQVGGMVAMNAGGVRAVRHGVMRDQIRGLEVVLPDGEIIQTGGKMGKLAKDNAGLNLMQLLIGSEGVLGIITRAMLKVYPEPSYTATLIASFARRSSAFRAVPRLIKEGIMPMAVEYVERDQIITTARDLGKEWPAKEGEGDLIIIMAEKSEDDFYSLANGIDKICTEEGATDILMADSAEEQKEIIEIRSHILPAIEDQIVDSPDITVPRSKLEEILDFLDSLAEKYRTRIPVLAHAGDGNLHTFIIKENGQVPSFYEELKEAMYKKTLELGGTITGEHGIGSLRRAELNLQFSDRELEIMWGIKKVFDPKNLLNPGKKVFPPHTGKNL